MTQNFKAFSSITDNGLEKSFIYLKCIVAVGEILEPSKGPKHHKICCKVYDEIFSDGVSAVYLASIAMDKPAYIVLRRVLELGVAAVYLWDMPHIAYSWNNFDHDLSFSEMLNHVNSVGYLKYVSDENSTNIDSDIFPTAECQKVYGELSDFVHGKITTFESILTDRFTFTENDWESFVLLVEKVLHILVHAYLTRYDISSELFKKVPQAEKEVS